jgi:hypothetical protein
MATQWQTFPIEFRGGLISNLSPLQHGTNAVGSATILQNFEPSKEGGYRKINGFSKYIDAEVPGTGPILGVKVVNVGETLAVRSDGTNTKIYHSAGTTWDLKATGTFNGGKARFAEVNYDGTHTVIIVDSTNYPAVLRDDGLNNVTYMTSPTDVLGASFVAAFKGTVFYAKGTSLTFTAPYTYDDFSVANGAGTINIGHEITGLAVFRDQLIVFSRNSIKRITGNTAADFVVASITDRIGCINPDTVQEVGGDIMYAAPDGIRSLSATDRIGDFGLDIASDPIQKDVYTFLQSSTVFASTVLREKAQYRIFSYTESEQADAAKGLIATKFLSQGASGIAWAETKGIKVNCADSKYVADYVEIILFANESGYVYRMDTDTAFDGEAIEAIYESPFMPITDPQMRKTFYKMTLYADPEGSMSLDVNLKFDFETSTNTGVIQPSTFNLASTGSAIYVYGDSNAIFGTATFGGTLDKVYQNNIIGSGKTVAIRIEDNSTNPSFALDTMLLEFRQNDRQ